MESLSPGKETSVNLAFTLDKRICGIYIRYMSNTPNTSNTTEDSMSKAYDFGVEAGRGAASVTTADACDSNGQSINPTEPLGADWDCLNDELTHTPSWDEQAEFIAGWKTGFVF